MPPSRRPQAPKALFKNRLWQQCYADWLRSIRELSGSTESQRSYHNLARSFFCAPTRNPDTYTRAEVEQFVRRPVVTRHRDGTLFERPAKPTTQNSRLTALRSFYDFAAQYDVPYRDGVRPILHTPSPTRGMKSLKIGRTRRDMTEEELKRLFAAVPRDTVQGKRDYAILSFYFWTARRRSEIARLRWGDIFDVVFIEGNRQRLGHMYRYSSKGHSREMFSAELPQPAYEALKEYLVAAGRWAQMTPEQPLFMALEEHNPYHKTEPLSGGAIWWIFNKYAKQAGLKDISIHRQICIHSLRHTRSRLQYKREHDPLKIQKLLGHSNLATTMIYLIDAEDEPDSGAALLASEFGNL